MNRNFWKTVQILFRFEDEVKTALEILRKYQEDFNGKVMILQTKKESFEDFGSMYKIAFLVKEEYFEDILEEMNPYMDLDIIL